MHVCKFTKNVSFRLKQIQIWTNESIIYCLYARRNIHGYILYMYIYVCTIEHAFLWK